MAVVTLSFSSFKTRENTSSGFLSKRCREQGVERPERAWASIPVGTPGKPCGHRGCRSVRGKPVLAAVEMTDDEGQGCVILVRVPAHRREGCYRWPRSLSDVSTLDAQVRKHLQARVRQQSLCFILCHPLFGLDGYAV